MLLLASAVEAQILPAFGGSRTGTTGFQFLKIAPDAQSAGMGEAWITSAHGVNAMFHNPAGITKLDGQKVAIGISHLKYFSTINLESAGAVYKLSDTRFLGASLVYLNSGEMLRTTEFAPFGTGETFRAVNMSFGLTYAQVMTDNFNFGLSGKFISESIADVQTTTVVFDFGFQYEVGLANTRFAVGLRNFGFNATPSGSIEVISLDGNYTADEFESIAPPAVFQLGFAWDPVSRDKHLLTISGQLNHPTDNNETLNFGLRYIWNDILIARTGYQLGQDEFSYPSLGLGLHFKRNFGNVGLDYAFTAKERLGANHRISLSLGLPEKSKEPIEER